MARIVLGSYMVRFPQGGIMSWVLQYLIGFQRLGHEVYLVERGDYYPNACFDPVKQVMSDDCEYGVRTVSAILTRLGMGDRWCFVDAQGCYHGLDRQKIQAVFDSADVFIDNGTHGSWLDAAARSGMRVLMDFEPAFTQMKMERDRKAGKVLPPYDYYYTCARNIGTALSSAPTAGKRWRPLNIPIVIDLFPLEPANPEAPFTTVMNWQSYKPFEYEGRTYGHKDAEFPKFESLPRLVKSSLEIAVSGKNVPTQQLVEAGWRVRNVYDITTSVDSYVEYIRRSRGEFSVCKGGYVDTQCGWFGERGASYLASGRPVVLQDSGFSAHLPCGEGLFAVRTVEQAAAAIDEIERNYARHARTARDIAEEYFDAAKVLGTFLNELGVP